MDFSGRNIEASDLPELDSFEKSKIASALILAFDKIEKKVNNDLLLHAHFKQHDDGGRRTKHTVNLKLSLPGHTFVASETAWGCVDSLQKALKVLEREAVEGLKRR